MKETIDLIQCPHCGKRYTMEEIFYPKNLVKGDTVETYECEQCELKFKVTAAISFRVEAL